MLSGNRSLGGKMRVPAISRLQKIHNMEVAFNALTQHNIDLTNGKGNVNCPVSNPVFSYIYVVYDCNKIRFMPE